MNMVPYLQAEEDRRFCASEDAEDAEEARVMEGVKGWTVGESVLVGRLGTAVAHGPPAPDVLSLAVRLGAPCAAALAGGHDL